MKISGWFVPRTCWQQKHLLRRINNLQRRGKKLLNSFGHLEIPHRRGPKKTE